MRAICAGIDAGSRTIKVALLEGCGLELVGWGISDQGPGQAARARELFARVLAESGVGRDEVSFVVATGYARNSVEGADTTVTEITCHARGVCHQAPEAATVIEIGGQDSKLLRLDGRGGVRDFAMNDRCAAGTGRFLEMVAERLEVGLEELGEMAGRSAEPATISSVCAVFAETEIIGLLAEGAAEEDIAAGVQQAIAERAASLAHGKVEEPVVFTGGVALVPGMERALAAALGTPVCVAADPQMTGAVGAAMLACERMRERAVAE